MRREPILAAALLAALAAPAAARTERSTYHTFDKVWSTAVRHLAIGEQFKILERDAETGYVTFEMTDKGKVYQGALEVVRVEDEDGRAAVRLVLNIGDRPSWMESAVLDRLLAKLYKEHGDPPSPPPKAKEKDKPRSREGRDEKRPKK